MIELEPTVDDVIEELAQLGAEGEYEAALALAETLVASLQTAVAPDRNALASGLRCLAVAHQCMGQYQQAAASADQAIALWDELGTSEDPMLAIALHTRAIAHLVVEEFEPAVPLLDRAATMFEKGGEAWHQELHAVLLTMAEVSLQLGELEPARSLYARLLEDLSDLEAESHEHASWINGMTAKVFLGLGGSYVRSQEATKAADYLARSIEFFESAYGVAHPEVLEAKQAVIEMYRQIGESEAADSLEAELSMTHSEVHESGDDSAAELSE